MEKNSISFRLRSDVVIELGLLRTFLSQVERLNFKRPLIIWDKNLKNSDYFESIQPQLEQFSVDGAFIPIELQGEPSYELLSKLLNKRV